MSPKANSNTPSPQTGNSHCRNKLLLKDLNLLKRMQLLKIRQEKKENMNRNDILISNKTSREASSSDSLLNFNMESIHIVFQKCQSSKNLARRCLFQMQPQKKKKKTSESHQCQDGFYELILYVPAVAKVQIIANISNIQIKFNISWKKMTRVKFYEMEAHSFKNIT